MFDIVKLKNRKIRQENGERFGNIKNLFDIVDNL